MKPALLVIDIQKAFLDISPVMTQSIHEAIRYTNAAIDFFREKGLPIIAVQHMNEAGKLIPGEAGFDLPESLKILPSDVRVHKKYGNSFKQTPLINHLQELGVDTVILTGFCAEHCVLSTYHGAQDNDLTPVMLRGSLASDVLENITFVENICETITLGALRKFLS
jgi:nicotinamidase-related amidase